MKFFKQIGAAFEAYIKAHQLIAAQRWWLYVLLPGLVHLFILIILFIVAWTFSDTLLDYILYAFGATELMEATHWFTTTLRVLLTFIIRLVFIIIYLALYKQIILLLLAPLFAYLSEKTEAQLTGKTHSFSIRRFINDILRGLLIAIRNLGLELGWIFVCYFITWLPVIGLLGPVLLFFIQSYFYGFSMIDYYLERQRYSVKESVRFMRKHRGLAIGNGLVFFGLMTVPLIGWMIAPVYSVIAATISVHHAKSSYEYDP